MKAKDVAAALLKFPEAEVMVWYSLVSFQRVPVSQVEIDPTGEDFTLWPTEEKRDHE